MREYLEFYIDGRWVSPAQANPLEVINPATEQVAGRISLGGAPDVDGAVTAARSAFKSYAHTSVAERLDLLRALAAEMDRRQHDVAAAIVEEMGAPRAAAETTQVGLGAGHLQVAIQALAAFRFEE